MTGETTPIHAPATPTLIVVFLPMQSAENHPLSSIHVVSAAARYVAVRRVLVAMAVLSLCLVGAPRPGAAQLGQDFLAANADSVVSPGDDFFQYANGSWFKRHPIPDEAARWGTWNVVLEEVDARLRQISENAARTAAPARRGRGTGRGSVEQVIGDFWFTGMDSVTINKQGLSPLRPDLAAIG